MAVVQTLIGNVKGPAGATGATGAQGPQGDAATIQVGSVTSAAYGTPASVTNSGTTGAAVLDFVIPQGKPGEKTTKMGELTLDTITTSTDSFPSPAVDDTGAVAFGKIRKFFADTLSALAAKIDTNKIADNLTTNDPNYVLSAAQGKALNDSLTTLTNEVHRADSPTSGGLSAFTAYADTVEAGRMQFFRMRAGTPSSAYNYSTGLILRSTSEETAVFMIGRTTHNILLLTKSSGTWDTAWTTIS